MPGVLVLIKRDHVGAGAHSQRVPRLCWVLDGRCFVVGRIVGPVLKRGIAGRENDQARSIGVISHSELVDGGRPGRWQPSIAPIGSNGHAVDRLPGGLHLQPGDRLLRHRAVELRPMRIWIMN